MANPLVLVSGEAERTAPVTPKARSAASRIRTVRYLQVSFRVWRAKCKRTMSCLPSGISKTALHNQPFKLHAKGAHRSNLIYTVTVPSNNVPLET